MKEKFHPRFVVIVQIIWHTPKLLDRLKCESEVKTTEEQGVEAWSLVQQHFEGRRVCWSSKMGLGRNDKQLIHSLGFAQIKQHIG
jgi:hypothetical protein